MPTFGRETLAYKQAVNVFSQILDRDIAKDLKIDLAVAINADLNYSEEKFSKVSNLTIMRDFNFGADINIALGFNEALKHDYDYLWIIGDDEPIPDGAIELICEHISNHSFDLLVGSSSKMGNFEINNSYQALVDITGGTNSFISSTIYNCKFFLLDDINSALNFSFTCFPHLVLINRVIERQSNLRVTCIPLLDICRVDLRSNVSKKITPRREFAYRDSIVFFGKPLALLGVQNKIYQKSELRIWWKKNWHRVHMYKHHLDFRPDLLNAITVKFLSLIPYIVFGKIPVWRVKNIIRPIKVKRSRMYINL